MKNLAYTTLAAVFASSVAVAHPALEETVPAMGATVDVAPTEVAMTFNEGVRLTKVELTFEEDEAIELEISGPDGFGAEFSVMPVGLGVGDYQIGWRGLGNDGHPIQGEFSYSVE